VASSARSLRRRVAAVVIVVVSATVVGGATVSLVGRQGAAPTTVASPGAPTPSADPAPAAVPDPAAARTALDELGGSAGIDPPAGVSVAARDTVTGASFQYGAVAGMDTASVVKLEILVATMIRHQDDGDQLTAEDRSWARAMITESDNDAAIALFDELGGTSALAAVNDRLGLAATTIGADGYFGFTTTSAADQVELLNVLNDPASVLSAENRAFALDLMRSVVPDQDWGVSAAADPGTPSAVKNGWLPVDSDDGLWAVASVGVVTVHGHPVLLAVLVAHLPTEGAGIDYIQRAASIAATAVTG
jgi:beta-lactamase class A